MMIDMEDSLPGKLLIRQDIPRDKEAVKGSKEQNQQEQKQMSNLNPYLAEQQIALLKEMFTSVDQNKDGSLVFEEILHFFSTMGVEVSENEIRDLISSSDINDNGAIQFNEFLPILTKFMTGRSLQDGEEELRIAFNMLDENGDGLISNEELAKVFTQIGQEVSKEDIAQFFRQADVNGDGLIDFEQFTAVLRDFS